MSIDKAFKELPEFKVTDTETKPKDNNTPNITTYIGIDGLEHKIELDKSDRVLAVDDINLLHRDYKI